MHLLSTVDQIKQGLDEMTKSERKVAAYFLGHPNDFAFYTLDKIAAQIGVSTTTVLRFCRRLEFEGFKDFQEKLRTDIKHQPNLPEKFQRTAEYSASNELLNKTVQTGILCLRQSFQEIPCDALEDALKRISSARRVFTFGMKESYALAHYLYTRLLAVRKDVYILNAGYNAEVESILSLTEEDVCVVFAFHRYSAQTLQILPMLRRQGAAVIVITSEPFDQVEPYATLLLPCRVDAGGIKNTAIAPICLSDYLCNAVAVLRGNDALEHMRKQEALYRSISTLGS